MKSKRLTGILIVFALITAIIVLCCTLFTVRYVDVNWLTTSKRIGYNSNNLIINSSGIKKGKSVFFCNKDLYTKNLEEQNPYLKVYKIVTKFPNKLEINVAEREEWFACKLEENKFAVLDDELKVLNILKSSIKPGKTNPAILRVENKLSLNNDDFVLGKKVVENTHNSHLYNIINTFCYSLKAIGYNAVNVKGILREVVINYNFDKTSVEIYTECGLKIIINKALTNLENKIVFAFSVYNKCRDNDNLYGTINVYENSKTNKIEGSFVPKA